MISESLEMREFINRGVGEGAEDTEEQMSDYRMKGLRVASKVLTK